MTVPDKSHPSDDNADYTDEYMIGKWGVFGLVYPHRDAPVPKHLLAWLVFMLSAAFGREESVRKH